jgi:ATP-dependent RNA helicase DDX27
MLPVLERLLYRSKRVLVTRVLVLTPTRELAAQIHEQTQKMAKHTDIRSVLVVGGLSLQIQEAALRARPDIIIGTPGRMIDHIRNTHSVHVDDLEILVSGERESGGKNIERKGWRRGKEKRKGGGEESKKREEGERNAEENV